MITNAIFYRLTLSDFSTGSWLDDAIDAHSFEPCGPNQEKSIGFVPPRGEEHGVLVESIGGQLIMKLMIETRTVPGSAITLKTKERVAHIEATTGRKPGKKETREIKDDIKLELLPTGFLRQSASLIWIDPVARLMVIDAASQARADEVVTMLVKAINGLACHLIDTRVSPTAAMSEWLSSQVPPAGFTVDRDCELKAADESKAVIRFSRSPLDTEEVKHYVESGKLPTRLALTWNSRVSFVLTDSLAIKRIQFLDVVFEAHLTSKQDGFDADVSILTGEMGKLIPDLLGELGGEVAL